MKNSIYLPILFIGVTLILFSSCTFKNKEKTLSFSESELYNSDDYFGLISEYSAGYISKSTPPFIRLHDNLELKYKYGEELPSDLFQMSPNISGEPYWIDEHTIGYRFDKIPEDKKKFKAEFQLGKIVNVPEPLYTFDLYFAIRPMDFYMSKSYYQAKDLNSCSYIIEVDFTYNVTEVQALQMVDKNTSDLYAVSAKSLTPTKVEIHIDNIPRSNRWRTIEISLMGEILDISKELPLTLSIPPANVLVLVHQYVNQENNSLEVYFSNSLKKNQILEGTIHISPQKKYKTNIKDNALIIYFENPNDEEISGHVTNLIDVYGNTLFERSPIHKFKLGRLLPEVKWAQDGYIVPTLNDTEVYFQAKSLSSVTIRFVKLYDDGIIRHLQENNLSNTSQIRKVGRQVRKINLHLDSPDFNQWKTFGIKLSDYVDVTEGEMYQIIIDFDRDDYINGCPDDDNNREVNPDSEYWNNESYRLKTFYYGDNNWWRRDNPCKLSYYNSVGIRKNILLSNIALTTKSALDGTYTVFARDIKTAKPLSATTITALNYQLESIAECTTDGEGICTFSNKDAYFIMASHNEYGKSFLKLENNLSQSYSKFDIAGVEIENNINGFIYSNRDIWRPGDSININFILSDKENRLPEFYPVILELHDSKNRLYSKKVVNTPVGNIYSFQVGTNVDDITGVWKAYVKIGNSTFSKSLRIETFKPNRLSIKFDLPDIVYLSEDRPIQLQSKWLNGLTASNLKATIDVKLRPTTTNFEKYRNYTFQDEIQKVKTHSLTLFNSTLNQEGIKNIDMDPLNKTKYNGFMNAYFTLKVFEPGGDFSITSRKTKVSTAPYYIGVQIPEPTSPWGDYYSTAKNWTFPLIVVSEKGEQVQNARLQYKVYKLNNYWWWSQNNDLSSYIKGSHYTPIINRNVNLKNGQADININIPNDNWGGYLIVVEDKEHQTRFSKVLFFDWDNYSRASSLSDEAATIKIKSDKESYEVGETVDISFPANKQSKAIITVESASKIIKTIRAEQLDDYNTISFETTEDMAPNVYVYVSLIQPYESGNDLPIRMYGIHPINVNPQNSKLVPIIQMPKETNSNQEMNISISEEKGKSMFYTLALVDEGVLGITNYQVPNPYRYFFSKYALNIRTWDNYQDIVDAYTGEMYAVLATGGDMMANLSENVLSKRFSAVAYSLGPFELEKGETQTHQIKIPEYLGSLRAMVVASDGKNAYGSADESVSVKNPLMLLPAIPRIVSPNDRAIIPIQVLAPEFKNSTVTIEMSGDKLTVEDGNKQVYIDDSGEGMVEMTIQVPNTTGIAELSIHGRVGSYQVSSTTQIPIREPRTIRHTKISKEVPPGNQVEFDFAVDGIQGSAKGSITLNSLVPLDIFSRLHYLTSYPFGCLEQTISSAFPQIYLESLTDLSDKEKEESRITIKNVINSLPGYLRTDYGLNKWKSCDCVNPWVEIYALHFLVEAKNAGYEVQDDMLNGIINYQMQKAKSWVYHTDFPTSDVIQAYRVFVLSLNNDNVIGSMNKLRNLDSLQNLSKALLAGAYANAGKVNISQNIMPSIDYTTAPAMSDYYITYGSKLRDIAMSTYAEILSDGNEQLIRKNIEYIGNALSEDNWYDTQSISMALFTLTKYAENKGFKNSPIDAKITVNGEERIVSANISSVSQKFEPQPKNHITVTNHSTSPFYATSYTLYSVPEYDFTESGNGYQMSVKYYDKNNEEMDIATMERNTDIKVVIKVKNTYDKVGISDNALSYLIPGGWNIQSSADNLSDVENHIDIRDDRVYILFDLGPGEEKSFTLQMNATYKGSYVIPSVRIEDMYDQSRYYSIPAQHISID